MLWKLGLGLPALALVVACATTAPSSSPTPVAAGPAPTLESIAGGYVLVAVDGRQLGANVVSPSSNDWPIVSGTLALRPNGTFRIETTYNGAADGAKENLFAFTGVCFKADELFQMIWDGGGETNFRVSGDTVVVNNAGKRFAYVRR